MFLSFKPIGAYYRMNRHEQIIFIQGHDPIMAKKIEYFREPYFEEMSRANPQHESV